MRRARRARLERSFSCACHHPLPTVRLGPRAFVAWVGGGFVCWIKPICVPSGGRGCSSTMKRQRLQLPDPATSLPWEPRSRAAFVTEEDTDPGHGGQGRRKGGKTLETITTTIKKKKKEGGLQAKRGEGAERDHVITLEWERGPGSSHPPNQRLGQDFGD